VGGNEEVVKSANYGILVDLENQKQLKNAIIEALEKKWDHQKIIEYASDNNWKKVAWKVLQEFMRIVSPTDRFPNAQKIKCPTQSI
jgi:IS30 family transposase